jgi:hypothetical protein
MNTAKSYKGCPVFIYCPEDNFIAEATVLEHDINWNVIVISESLKDHSASRFEIIILHPGGVSEYKGTPRTLHGFREIALFKHHQRKGRSSDRHAIYEPAEITVVSADKKPISPARLLLVENISTTGVLIKSPEDYFNVKSILELKITISGKEVILYAEIVRIKENNNNYDVGCQFIFQNMSGKES